jgi:uncharacterized protein
MVASSPEEIAGAPARPVGTHERLTLLDVLRGFALCGVFLSNLNVWFSGRVFLPQERVQAMMAKPVNNIAAYVFGFFIFGKFVTMFSFLFGLGFAIQLIRAEGRGASIVPVYARRLGAMFIIGLVHIVALWYGDILNVYAVTGFSLLLFRRRSDRALLFWALGLILVFPLLFSTGERFLPLLFHSPEELSAASKAATERSVEHNARTLADFAGGSYLTAMRASMRFLVEDFQFRPMMIPFFAVTVGKFLLGFYAGRRRLFHEPSMHLPLFRRLLVWGLVIGVIGTGVGTVMRYLSVNKIIHGPPSWRFLLPPLQEGGMLGLGMFYIAALTLLFQRPAAQRFLLVFAPAGRMALTNYLSQSVISVLIFYGFGLGLIGKIGPALCIAMTLGLFLVQMVWSRLWLSSFRFGPAEWLWRSMTYGKAQPMRSS